MLIMLTVVGTWLIGIYPVFKLFERCDGDGWAGVAAAFWPASLIIAGILWLDDLGSKPQKPPRRYPS